MAPPMDGAPHHPLVRPTGPNRVLTRIMLGAFGPVLLVSLFLLFCVEHTKEKAYA